MGSESSILRKTQFPFQFIIFSTGELQLQFPFQFVSCNSMNQLTTWGQLLISAGRTKLVFFRRSSETVRERSKTSPRTSTNVRERSKNIICERPVL